LRRKYNGRQLIRFREEFAVDQEHSVSVSHWIGRLKAGDPEAARRLWQTCSPRLVRLARKRLDKSPRRAADEEDVALSAFHSFCEGARKGQFPCLGDRNDLWRLLMVITSRKATKQANAGCCQKRGGGRVQGESAFLNTNGHGETGIETVADPRPTPEFAAELAEQFWRLLERLGDESLQQVALLKLEGFSNQEIAEMLDCALRTVERRLRGIRAIWSEEA
jgi:DNA-directed RNA polymerase specialized sigma24 family protein